MQSQTIDMGLSRSGLEAYLQQIGYWGDAELRGRNAYVLSPSAYAISQEQRKALERLSVCTYVAVKTLSEKLTQLARTKSITNDEARFLSIATRHTRGLLGPSQVNGEIPSVMKVDLVQDATGRYFAAEVDAYNARGFAYLGFLDDTVPKDMRTSGRGTGIEGLADLMRRKERYDYGPWMIIVTEKERYYDPSLRILANLLKEHGVYAKVFREHDVFPNGFNSDGGANVFCIPESMDKNVKGRDFLTEQSRFGGVHLFYPPAAYLGSKAFLPFLREQSGMDEFIPQSSLVCKRSHPLADANGTPFVLKGVMSSGLKKVVFSDSEPKRFVDEYAAARQTKNPQWMLQEQVPQEPVPIVVFDDEGNRVTRDYYLRITAYVTEAGLLGAEVTGRPDRAVHGAPDCVQIPAIVQ